VRNPRVPWPIYQLKITLRDIQPPIWRRIQVASDVTLYQLHNLLQLVMGWSDSHLHQFAKGRTFYGTPDQEFGDEVLPEKEIRLKDVLVRPRERMLYEYDFGDSWHHRVTVEKILDPDPGTSRIAQCLGGKRVCPPEDCGGIPGFYDLLEALSDPHHERHAEMREWIGGDYDPEAFSVDNVNRSLTFLQRRRGKTPRK